jgi:hypothetical protein
MNEDLEHVRRARARSLILLLVVLLVGILVGAAEERYLLQQMTAHSASANPPHTYPGALGRMNLTASQRAAIDSVLDLERPRIEAIMQPLLPELHAKADSMRAAVRTVLTPEQQRMFDREPHAQGTELIRRFSKMTAPPDTTP